MTKEVMQQALDAFEIIFETTMPYRDDGECTFHADAISTANAAIAALEAAIAQPVQPDHSPLSDAQAQAVIDSISTWRGDFEMAILRATEKAHGIGAVQS